MEGNYWSYLLFSHSVMSNSLWPHGLQHTRPPCSSSSPGACSNSCPLSWWCHPIISSFVVPFSSCFQSFPASGSFLMSQFFASGRQSIGASASVSVLPMNIQNWFPWGLTTLISWESFSRREFKSITPSTFSLLYGPTFISMHDYWKNYSFDYMDLCWQNNVSTFEYAV